MRILAAFAALAAILAPQAPSRADGTRLRLKAEVFDPVAEASALEERLTLAVEPGAGVFIVQFEHGASTAARAAADALGSDLLGYLPENAHLVRLGEGQATKLRATPGVRWVGPVQPGWKLAPDLGTRPFEDPARRSTERMSLLVDLFSGARAEDVLPAVQRLGIDVVQVVRIARPSPRPAVERLRVRADEAQAVALAHLPDVAWIEEEAEIRPRNDESAWVLQGNVVDEWPVWDHGLHGQGQIVGLIDEPLDINSCFFRDESNNDPGPGHRKVIAYRSSSGIGAAEHGTHVGGTLAGDRLPDGGVGEWGGMAPAARISFGSLWDITGGGGQPSNLYQALADAHADGARIHSNSWGDDGTDAYTAWSRDIDMFSYDHEDSLVVQAGTNLSTPRSPENAKNGLSVGASKKGTQAHARCHGSIGPTSDGRRKPEVLAPGCFIISARALYSCSTFALDGTSMATPAVAGIGALVRQYYQEGWYPTGSQTAADALGPSGALVKATLLNSTVDMTGEPGYPSNEEGWGRPLIENALHFTGDTRRLSVIADVRNADGLATGESVSYDNEILGGAEPLKVTLVWTEPPAEVLAEEATVNDLDLEVVSPSGTAYLGNAIDTATGQSVPDGSPDPRNNVEMVIVPAAEAGLWTMRVIGAAVQQGRQGFALIASGDVEPYEPYPLEHDDHSIQDDAPLGNDDGIVDPGETIVMPETLRNVGDEHVDAIAGRLGVREADLVKITGREATYPDIAGGGTATTDSPHYRYTVSPDTPCGATLHFDIELSSSAGEGRVGFSVDVGCNALSCPDGPAPSEEVSGLLVARSGAEDLLLSWDALAAASAYRVWKSPQPAFGAEQFVGSTSETQLVETAGAIGDEVRFYVVRATNSCGWEGP